MRVEHLDAAHGSCALPDPRLGQIVAERLHHFDGQRYDLGSYVIMPNHVHVLFTLRDGESLPDTLQGWKGVSSRLIRRPEHFSTVKAYIRENPAMVWQGKQPEEVSRQAAKKSPKTKPLRLCALA